MLINENLYRNIRAIRFARPKGLCGQNFTATDARLVTTKDARPVKRQYIQIKWNSLYSKRSTDYFAGSNKGFSIYSKHNPNSFVSSDEGFSIEMLSTVDHQTLLNELDCRLSRFESFWFATSQEAEKRGFI